MTGTALPYEKEYFRKDGSRVPILIGVATLEEGKNQGVAFVLDLTERKAAETALREQRTALPRLCRDCLRLALGNRARSSLHAIFLRHPH